MKNKFIKEKKYTERGFGLIQFTDLYGADSSIQDSSLATEAAIWLGNDKPTINPVNGQFCGCRMHLDIDRAKWLIKQLKYFVKNGTINISDK